MKFTDLIEHDKLQQYKSLNDASVIVPELKTGNTEIWYMKKDSFRDFSGGYNFLKKHNMLPTKIGDIKNTHIILGKIKETNPEKIFHIMQGEVWSPNGEANNLIKKMKLAHTSMSVGDIIKTGNKLLMVDFFGFKEIELLNEGKVLNFSGKKKHNDSDNSEFVSILKDLTSVISRLSSLETKTKNRNMKSALNKAGDKAGDARKTLNDLSLTENEIIDNIDDDIKRIAKLTDVNNHGEAIVVGLQLLGNDKMVSDLVATTKKINLAHEKLGNLSSNLKTERDKVYHKMMSIAKKRLDARQFKKFNGAF